MLPLTFEDPADYDKIDPFDKVSLKGLTVRRCCRGYGPLLLQHLSLQTIDSIGITAATAVVMHSCLTTSRRAVVTVRSGACQLRCFQILSAAGKLQQSWCFGVQGLAEGSSVTLEGTKEDGSTYSIPLAHTFNDNQIKWFKAGSALNAVRSRFGDCCA